jgi:hypothetical protein
MLPNVIQIPKLFAIQYWVTVNGTYCWVLLVSWRERGGRGWGWKLGTKNLQGANLIGPPQFFFYWSFEHAK